MLLNKACYNLKKKAFFKFYSMPQDKIGELKKNPFCLLHFEKLKNLHSSIFEIK